MKIAKSMKDLEKLKVGEGVIVEGAEVVLKVEEKSKEGERSKVRVARA